VRASFISTVFKSIFTHFKDCVCLCISTSTPPTPPICTSKLNGRLDILLCYCTKTGISFRLKSVESQISPAACVSCCYTLARLTCRRLLASAPLASYLRHLDVCCSLLKIESHEVTAYHELRHHHCDQAITPQTSGPFPYGFSGYTFATHREELRLEV